jgi:hypothetical protein
MTAEHGKQCEVASSRMKRNRQQNMAEPRTSSLKKDFGIFRDPGFLVTLILIGLLSAVTAYILIHASNEYGVPIRDYWK